MHVALTYIHGFDMTVSFFLEHKHLILASSSPRRLDILSRISKSVQIIPPIKPEPPTQLGESPQEFVKRLSLLKVSEAAASVSRSIIIGADTAVVFKNHVLGKPEDCDDAKIMLRLLRGKYHRVLTGITVLDSYSGNLISSCTSTTVLMRDYSDNELSAYVDSGSPLDKAGGYGIQDIEFSPVSSVDGCYLNVVGLPLCTLLDMITELSIEFSLTPELWRERECVTCPYRPGSEICQ